MGLLDLKETQEILDLIKGNLGTPGLKGDMGSPGPKGAGTGGVVYLRWGHNSCPSGGAKLVYTGRAGGPYYGNRGGGSNPIRPNLL